MAFFRNRIVNLLNLHYGIHAIAMSGGGAFFAIYLLRSGVPIPGVLSSLALILLGRFAIRPLVVTWAPVSSKAFSRSWHTAEKTSPQRTGAIVPWRPTRA